MKRKVKTLLFGNDLECRAAGDMLSGVEALSEHLHEHCHTSDLEEFEAHLVDWNPTLLIVLADGAKGMESVYRARERRPFLPVFWFSDDHEFGIQSYRLNCAYFSTKPVTLEKITHAVQRCDHVGVTYTT